MHHWQNSEHMEQIATLNGMQSHRNAGEDEQEEDCIGL
jgi:hypothetical protein